MNQTTVQVLAVRWKTPEPGSGYEKMVGNSGWVDCSQEEIDRALDQGINVLWNPVSNRSLYGY